MKIQLQVTQLAKISNGHIQVQFKASIAGQNVYGNNQNQSLTLSTPDALGEKLRIDQVFTASLQENQ